MGLQVPDHSRQGSRLLPGIESVHQDDRPRTGARHDFGVEGIGGDAGPVQGVNGPEYTHVFEGVYLPDVGSVTIPVGKPEVRPGREAGNPINYHLGAFQLGPDLIR